MPYLGARPTDVFADRDLNGQEFILDADADTSITSDTDDQIDIKIAGADDFQLTANTFTVLSGSTLAVASGATIANSGTATGFGVSLANDGNNRIVTADGSGGLNGEANLVFDGSLMFLNDSANGGMTDGLTINQTGADNEILSLKSSDVSHGYSAASEETDTFALFSKRSADGGLFNKVYMDTTNSTPQTYRLEGYSGGANSTSPGSGSQAACHYYFLRHDGSNSKVSFDANEVVYTWAAQSTDGERTIMVLDEDGDLFLDGAVGTAYDAYDDAALLRAFSTHSAPDQVIKTGFDNWVKYNLKDLQAARIVSDPDEGEGDPMWNISQHTKLLTGGVVQNRAMIETMKQVAEEMLPGFGAKLNERLVEQNLPALPIST